MQYTLYTDGACSGNPGPGGYAAILVAMDDAGVKVDEREIVGGEAHTTNNRMEISAVLEGLRALEIPSKVVIVTDSEYVMKTMTKGWKRNKNGDLWEQLDDAIAPHRATWKYVKGHAGHEYNERCDQLAVQASRQYRK